MKTTLIRYSRSDVNKAGSVLCKKPQDLDVGEYFWAFDVLNYWRSSHSYPINTFQANLRAKLKRKNIHGFVAQRLKRVASIIAKLRKQEKMQLARMQDIGGLRGVVRHVVSVRRLRDAFIKSKFSHELVKENDYIQSPRNLVTGVSIWSIAIAAKF